MQDLTLGIANVILQLCQHRHRSRNRRSLEYIFLPVLAHSSGTLGHIRTQTGLDQTALFRIAYHLGYTAAINGDGIIQLLAARFQWRKHHLRCSLQILTVTDIMQISLHAIRLSHNSKLQFISQVVQRITHRTHPLCLFVPLSYLGGISLVLLGKILVYLTVDISRVPCRKLQLLCNKSKTLQHIVTDIQRQHGHQHDVHQIYHLLTRRYLLFPYFCHYALGAAACIFTVKA